MDNWFNAGGVFMWPMTILWLAMLALAGKVMVAAFSRSDEHASISRYNNVVLQGGIFIFFLGVLSQAIGLMQAFQVIQQIGDVSPALLSGGLYVSMIAPVYGLIILISALVLWSITRFKIT